MIATTKPKGRGKANSTIEFERVILEIVAERSPITVRGVAYALFTRGLISSMNTNNTQKVSRVTFEPYSMWTDGGCGALPGACIKSRLGWLGGT